MILTFIHEAKVDIGMLFCSNELQLQVEASQYNHSLLQLDNKKLPFGNQGLSDLLKGTSPRFSQSVKVCEPVTFLLTTCLAVLQANAALDIY